MMTFTHSNRGNLMRLISAAFIALMLVSGPAAADCVGTDTFKTCYDDSGNTHDINKIGNTTYLEGHNSRTGSNWSQESRTIGNTTYHSGRAADGDRWSSTEQRIGNMRFISGQDSDGNYFSETIRDPYEFGDEGLLDSGSDDSLFGGSDSLGTGDLLYDDSLYDDDW